VPGPHRPAAAPPAGDTSPSCAEDIGRSDHAITRDLAAHAFGTSVAYQARDVRSFPGWLTLVLGVLRVAARRTEMRPTITVLVVVCSLHLSGGPASAQSRAEKVDGYAEFHQGDAVVVDGQRVVITPATKLKVKGARVRTARDVPLGFDVEAEGVRDHDGRLIAAKLAVKPNGVALFENDVREATNTIESMWLREGEVYHQDGRGRRERMGRVVSAGPQVDRVQRIIGRLRPPYVGRDSVRVHVVESQEWNAMAMGNGSLWVFTGLLDDMDDDEVAIVLGHELAHFTHEHSRRGMKRALWAQLLAAGIVGAAETVDSRRAQELIAIAGVFSLTAWQSGYGRTLEDQADRVGMRYAYEGGFDVSKGPRLWARFTEKYGNQDAVTNFFFSHHSRSSVRQKNLHREISLNYQEYTGTVRP
jgi:Zn-dependent protease with chaperone function